MMVVVAGAEEGGAGIAAGDVESQEARIEFLSGGDGAHLQMHVADGGTRGEAAPGYAGSAGQEIGGVERFGGHGDEAIGPLPLSGGAVGVDLDAIALRVREVDGLADEMVRGALQALFGGNSVLQPGAEIRTGGQKESGVEQARLARGMAARLGIAAQFQQHGVADPEQGLAGVGGDQVQADRVLVEAADAVEVVNNEDDPAYP